MKILIVVPRYDNTTSINYRYMFPLNLGYISAVLKKTGYNVDCFNLNHHTGLARDLIKDKLDQTKYKYVCLGHMALGYSIVKEIIDTVKSHDSKPLTILGGPIVTSEPDFMIGSLKPDFAVLGEGEVTILELIKCIETGGKIREVNGLSYIDLNGKIQKTPPRAVILDLDSLPYPDFDGLDYPKLLDNARCNYRVSGIAFDYPRDYPILGSRGCPYQCTFCYHSLGTKYRQRAISSIIDELSINIRKYKINSLFFYDDLFSVDKSRLYELCKSIKVLFKDIPWEVKWGCQLMVNSVDLPLLKALKDSGCHWISYGFESMSPVVLRSMKKATTPEKIISAFELTKQMKITVIANFIFGDLAETKETANETLKTVKEIFEGQIVLRFIQPYPGSHIYENCLERNIIKDKLKFIKYGLGSDRPVYYNFTNKMTTQEFNKLKKDIFKAEIKYSRFAIPTYFKQTAENIYSIKVSCPYCKAKLFYKNFLINNKFYFASFLGCRSCGMHFFITSTLKKMINSYHYLLRPIFDFYVSVRYVIFKKLTFKDTEGS